MKAQEKIVKNKDLIEKYPFLLPAQRADGSAAEDYDYSYTWLDFMPEGWRKAFGEQMCEEVAEALREENCLNGYRVFEVKEKWGYLHWYDCGGTDEVYKIVSKYEGISKRTCCKCGKPATKRSVGWVCPYCDRCTGAMAQHERFENIAEVVQNDLS